jgi:uncharacterized membrane protein YdjX (TVP38/TMEM64 family)
MFSKHPWIRTALAVVVLSGLAAIWVETPLREVVNPDRLSETLEPHRHAWYGLPLTMATFVVLGLVMVPVLALVLVTGIAFGPWMGPPYALAGCLSSAMAGFFLGRRLGRRTVERLAGERARRVAGVLERNGTLAVFLVRKVPAPYTLVNLVMGASRVRFLDFMIGTALGMGPLVVAMSVFGHQLTETLRRPSAVAIGAAVALLLIPLLIAVVANRSLGRRRERA